MRAFYLGWTLAFMAAVGRTLDLWPEVATVLIIASCLVLGVGLFRHIYGPRWSVFYLVATTSVLWYAFPMSYMEYATRSSYSLISTDTAWRTLSVILLFLLPLPLLSTALSRLNFDIPFLIVRPRRGYLLTLVLIAAFQAYLIYTGAWSYGVFLDYATATEKPQALLAMTFVARPLLMVTALVLAGEIREYGRVSIGRLMLYGAVFLVEFAWLTIDGRRILAISIILALVLALRTIRDGRPIPFGTLLRYGVLAVPLAVAVLASWSVFFTLRQASYIDSLSGGNVFDVLAQLDSRQETVSTQFQDNLVNRPFSLIEGFDTVTSKARGLMFGVGIVNAALTSVPSALWPSKADVVAPDIEHLWSSMLGVPLNDWSNTLLLEGYVDFGLPGPLIYLLIVTAIFTIGLGAARMSGFGLLVAFATSSTLFILLSVETSSVEHFVWLRNMLALSAMAKVAGILFASSRRSALVARPVGPIGLPPLLNRPPARLDLRTNSQ